MDGFLRQATALFGIERAIELQRGIFEGELRDLRYSISIIQLAITVNRDGQQNTRRIRELFNCP